MAESSARNPAHALCSLNDRDVGLTLKYTTVCFVCTLRCLTLGGEAFVIYMRLTM
jgi:hypothetical protein